MKKMNAKRIVALIGIVLLVLLYVVTLLVAIVNPGESGGLLRVCIAATIAIPVLLWFYIWLYGVLTGKKTIASIDADPAVHTDKEQADDDQ